jgi:hypothetical protein
MTDKLAKEWLETKFPNMRTCDVNWTMKRYDFPVYVCEYIKNNWKENVDMVGTYHKPECGKEDKNKSQTESQTESQTNPEIIRNKIEDKVCAKLYKPFAKGMDDKNKEALRAAEEGIDNAVKHMMSSAGGNYARMRSMYG